MFVRGNCGSSEEGHPFSPFSHFFDKEKMHDFKWKKHSHWGHHHNKEVFSQNDFNFLILTFLNEKPSYGFEIIKSIEDKSEGGFSPKAESIYPTLTNLDDLGYAKIDTEENGKKIYSITDAGIKYLEANKEAVEKVLLKLNELKYNISVELKQSLKRIGFTVFSTYFQKEWTNNQLRNLITILDKTVEDIKKI